MSSSKSSSSDEGCPLALAVDADHAGSRLDKVLAAHAEISSREIARRLIAQGAALLNSRPAEPSSRVRDGDRVEFHLPPPLPSTLTPQSVPLTILHEDDWLIVIDKPAGVPMHPGPGHPDGTLVNFLLAHCSNLSGIGGERRPGIVHRLDKDTSGVVVVAKNDWAHLGLARQFEAHSIARTYFALVIGRPAAEKGRIDLPLSRHRKSRLKRSVEPDGKCAVTHWRVERRFSLFTLLRLNLETGRTHQIRVHLAAQGWPVLADPLYGGSRWRGLSLSEGLREKLSAIRRQALHAAELGFVHPQSGERLAFSSALPAEMEELLQALAADEADSAPEKQRPPRRRKS